MNYWRKTLPQSEPEQAPPSNPWAAWPVNRCSRCIAAGATIPNAEVMLVAWHACDNTKCVVGPPDTDIPF